MYDGLDDDENETKPATNAKPKASFAPSSIRRKAVIKPVKKPMVKRAVSSTPSSFTLAPTTTATTTTTTTAATTTTTPPLTTLEPPSPLPIPTHPIHNDPDPEDPYDPLVPNDYVEFKRNQSKIEQQENAQKLKAAINKEKKETSDKILQDRIDAQNRGDYQTVKNLIDQNQSSVGRGRGGRSNVPAWMMKKLEAEKLKPNIK